MKILVSIGGYGASGSEPITLAALKDEVTGVLVIQKQVKYRAETLPGYAFVTNMRQGNYDCLFTEEHLGPSIRAYKEADGMGTIVLAAEVAKYRPRIEVDGIDPKGQKYRLSESMGNGELAVLALIHFMSRQKAIDSTQSASDRIMRMYEIHSI